MLLEVQRYAWPAEGSVQDAAMLLFHRNAGARRPLAELSYEAIFEFPNDELSHGKAVLSMIALVNPHDRADVRDGVIECEKNGLLCVSRA